jgi:HD-GYP domain-containing protein (c-di-GMP phosphodiesterase class II)
MGYGTCPVVPMTSSVQQSLTKSLGRMRLGATTGRTREIDLETGLRTRACLHTDLARIHSSAIPARLELLALNAGDGLDDILLTNGDAELPSRIGTALREATEAVGARAYRLDVSLYAFLGPLDAAALTPAAMAHEALSEISERLASGAVRGEARIPDEATAGREALAVAHERLRARSRWQRLSSERQVRDVLLQVLSERRAGGSAIAQPRVAAYAIGVGRRLGLALGELDDIVRAAELQDIGMLSVPESVLRKRSALEPEEWAMIRRHPAVGERILSSAPALEPVAKLVRSSYERFDGTGYPDGIGGEQIPLGSRVIAVCVAYDAMTSARPYREALPTATAFEELCRCAGRQFDPMVVAAFCAEMNQLDPEAAVRAS